MDILRQYIRFKYLGHILFWLISVVFAVVSFKVASQSEIQISPDLIIRAIIPNAGFAFAVYFNLFVLIPRLLRVKQYIYYSFCLILLLFVTSLAIQAALIPFSGTQNELQIFGEIFSWHFFTAAIYVAITSSAKLTKDWLNLQELNIRYQKLELEKKEVELISLKSQLNPHFLFNSLNNIYSLALTKSADTPEAVLRLSDMMRYILYESTESFVPISKEIAFVKDYIDLQKLRISETIDIQFHTPEQIPDIKVMPLLFEPFIDNAFKHGLKNPAPKPYIHGEISFTDSRVIFRIENNVGKLLQNEGLKKAEIGLKNVRKRLDYHYGQSNTIFNINNSDNSFSVELEVPFIQ